MAADRRLRLVTVNLWQEQGPHQERLVLLGDRLAALAPDVIALQEVRDKPPGIPNQARALAERLGMQCAFAPVVQWGGGIEGLAVLSRHPIVGSDALDLPDPEQLGPRRVLRARIAAPAGEIVAASTHLAYPLAAGLTREAQVLAAEAFVRDGPPATLTALMGDFNAAPDTDEIRFLRGATTLAGRRTVWQDAYALARPGDPGLTWARRNPYTAALAHVQLDRRIDYVFVSPRARDGRGAVLDARVILDEPDAAGTWCTDHFGVLADVQAAPGP